MNLLIIADFQRIRRTQHQPKIVLNVSYTRINTKISLFDVKNIFYLYLKLYSIFIFVALSCDHEADFHRLSKKRQGTNDSPDVDGCSRDASRVRLERRCPELG